jgi:hypothetical protein
MAMVAMLCPADFPQMGPSSQNGTGNYQMFAKCRSTAARSKPRQSSRPALARQVAPVGWTMCECEADKEWVLCDRAEAMAAELAGRFQEHVQQDEAAEAPTPLEVKEATMRQAHLQMQEEEREELRKHVQLQLDAEECEEDEEAAADADPEEVDEDRSEAGLAKRKSSTTRPSSVPRRVSSRRHSKRAEVKARSDTDDDHFSRLGDTTDFDETSKDMTRAERKAAWRAAQAMKAVSPPQHVQSREDGSETHLRSKSKGTKGGRRGRIDCDEDC